MLAGNLTQFFSYLHVFQLLSGLVAELLTILDSCFTDVANTTSTPTGWEGEGWMGCHKVAGKGYSNTDNKPNGIHCCHFHLHILYHKK